MTGKTDQLVTDDRTRLERTGTGDGDGLHAPRLTLRQLTVFLATARSGSTRAASEQIARSQSAASSALADLEVALGAPVFDRVGRRLVLNENGRALLPRAQALLEQALDLQDLFRTSRRASLRVGASFTIGEYLLPAHIARWTQSNPQQAIRLRIGNTREIVAAVADFDVDVGFIEGPQSHHDLLVRPWLEDELVIIAASRHPLAKSVATPRQLAGQTWVLRERGSGTRQATDDWLSRHLPDLRIGHELGSTEAIKRMVAASTSLGCLSRHALDDGGGLETRRLVALRTRLPVARRSLAIVLHRQRPVGAITEAFLRHCGA